VASSWFLFFSYHNDARSNTHQTVSHVTYPSTRKTVRDSAVTGQVTAVNKNVTNIRCVLLSNSLVPCSRVLPEKLLFRKLVKKDPH